MDNQLEQFGFSESPGLAIFTPTGEKNILLFVFCIVFCKNILETVKPQNRRKFPWF